MGTIFEYRSKNELRSELRSTIKGTVLADRTVGNHWWAAVETAEGARVLVLAKMSLSQGECGYKFMDEGAGLTYDLCDCPISLLDLVEQAPLPENLGEQYREWVHITRSRIRAYHEAKHRTWTKGDACEIHGEVYTVVGDHNGSSFVVQKVEDGGLYRGRRVDMKPVSN